jgi:hypothetical protein
MHESDIKNSPRVAAELSQTIIAAISQHDQSVRENLARIQGRHLTTLAAATIALGGTLIPSIAPYLGQIASITGLGGMYAATKIDEYRSRAKLSRSLLGVLTSAYENAANEST